MLVDLDYMLIYKCFLWGSLKRYSLNFVAEHELSGEIGKEDSEFKDIAELQKIDWRKKTGLKKFWQLYLVEPEMLKEYNIQDVNLMFMIEQKLKYLHLGDVISKETHSLVQDTIYNSRALDNRMLIEYKKENLISDSRPTKAEMERRKLERISGGYTYVFKRGLFWELVCNDFKSSYPCHIVTYNISPETYVMEIQPKLTLVFTEKEIEYINYCVAIKAEYLDSKGELRKPKYLAAIEVRRKVLEVRTMFELGYLK
jgi:DNA polymerase elongation subunit (family B)